MVAVSYTTSAGLELRTFDGASLSAPSTVVTWPAIVGGLTYADGYGPAVQPTGAAGVAVAVAGCRPNPPTIDPCDPVAAGSRIDILYRSTPDGGATWDDPLRLSDSRLAPYRLNDEPSLTLTGATQRITFDRYDRAFQHYDVWSRSSI